MANTVLSCVCFSFDMKSNIFLHLSEFWVFLLLRNAFWTSNIYSYLIKNRTTSTTTKKTLFAYLVPYWWTCRFLSNFNLCFKLWWNKHLYLLLRLCWRVFPREGISEQICFVLLKIWPFDCVFAPFKIIYLVIVGWLESKPRNSCSILTAQYYLYIFMTNEVLKVLDILFTPLLMLIPFL